jgi:adenosylhomocysteine nucleosidase
VSGAIPAVIVALQREAEAVAKGWQREELPGKVHLYTNGSAIVACAGMGAVRAEIAARAAMARMPVTVLISAGLAGGASTMMRVGDVVRPGVVIDGATEERFEGEGPQPVLVTLDAIASRADKARLQTKFRADVIDMEAAGVARVAREAGLEFRAVKAISDEYGFELESTSQFVTSNGQFREGAFVMYALLRPSMWKTLMALARNSTKALQSLTFAIEAELAGYEES